jgi:hypothetical protein
VEFAAGPEKVWMFYRAAFLAAIKDFHGVG